MAEHSRLGAGAPIAAGIDPHQAGAAGGQRLYFVQWFRGFLIVSVVAHHSAEAYMPDPGGWPFKDPSTTPCLSPMMALNAANFMGFFFLILGYFLEGSYDRKGGWDFVKSRLVRLGIPLIFFVVFFFGFARSNVAADPPWAR